MRAPPASPQGPGSQPGGAILCLNAGSSSLKFAVYVLEGKEEYSLAQGAIEGIAQESGRLRWRAAETGHEEPLEVATHSEALDLLERTLERWRLPAPVAAGHRIVHGGARFREHCLIDPAVLAALRSLVPLAPLHLPPALDVIEATSALWPELPQAACFDTAFHQRMPDTARRLPLPQALHDRGVQRYGFHGLSYEWCVEALAEDLPERMVVAHLGNGASLAAIHRGRPAGTTMGMTPSGGLMMGTRTGDLDPGVLLYLLRQEGLTAEALARLIDWESGLLGVSGLSSDMKTLLEQETAHPGAALAVEMFCLIAAQHVAAMAVSLGGLDALVFTGGIGEHAAAIRARICSRLRFLGLELDAEANQAHRAVISAQGSPVTARIVRAQEERVMARWTRRLMQAPRPAYG